MSLLLFPISYSDNIIGYEKRINIQSTPFAIFEAVDFIVFKYIKTYIPNQNAYVYNTKY